MGKFSHIAADEFHPLHRRHQLSIYPKISLSSQLANQARWNTVLRVSFDVTPTPYKTNEMYVIYLQLSCSLLRQLETQEAMNPKVAFPGVRKTWVR